MKNTLALISFSLLATACADTVKTRELDRTSAATDSVGAAGDQGEKGEKGDKGDTGDVGPAGAQGIPGIQGIQGATGPQGLKGDKGEKGDKGDKGDAGSISKIRFGKLTDITKLFSSSSKIMVDFNDASLAQINLSFMLLRSGADAGAEVHIYVIDEDGNELLQRVIDVHSGNNVKYQEFSHSFILPKGALFFVKFDNQQGVYVKYAQYTATLMN